MKTINICSQLKIDVVNNYKEVLNTDYIFIPIDDESKIVVSINSKVLKGSLVYDGSEKIYSSISGVVLNVLKQNNKKYLVIKNDYKELSNNIRARDLSSLNKEMFLKLIKSNDIKGILVNKINNLYINAIDDDPYVYNKYMYVKNNIKDIADISSCMKKLFNINNIKIVIKNNYIELLNDYKVDVSFVKVPNIYPLGNNKLLQKYIINDKNDYLIDLNDIINLIYDVKKNKIRTEEYITINGNNVERSYVINIKKYSYLNNILQNIKVKDNDYDIVLNNSLCGQIVNPKNVILDGTVKGIMIMKKEKYNPSKCSKCGLCNTICPMKINPLEKNSKCIKCGLCNYVCPSKINIVDEVQR